MLATAMVGFMTINKNAMLARNDISAREGYQRLESLIRGAAITKTRTWLEGHLTAGTTASVTDAGLKSALAGISSINDGTTAVVVDGTTTTVGNLEASAPPSHVNARTRCNNGPRVVPASNHAYFCVVFRFDASTDLAGQKSVTTSRPAFAEVIYSLRKFSNSAPINFNAADAATELGALVYYTIYWQRDLTRMENSFRMHTGFRYVAHKP